MTPRDNFIQMYRRNGYDEVPVGFNLCKSLEEEFKSRYPEALTYMDHFKFPYRNIIDPGFSWNFENLNMIPGHKETDWSMFYPEGFQYDVKFDGWGIAHETSPNSMHMTKMHHPMKNFNSLKEIQEYPLPDYSRVDFTPIKAQIDDVHKRGLAAFVWQECTIWETAWYLRSMENMMTDMAMEDEKATWLLDEITDRACYRSAIFSGFGADILGLGDDIGIQSSIMMPPEMYREWLKPRLTRVIQAAKNANPDILISYHSCGFIEPFIPDLIEAGIDILNPVQPECMDFRKIHGKYGNLISFSGTIGTQQLMPYGTPIQVKNEVNRNLNLVGRKGGLFCCPTHMLEPEVPWENIEAYLEACRNYKK